MKIKNLLAVALLGSASLAQAAHLSFTGNFIYDNDVQRFTFVVSETSSVTLRTWGWAGGTNAAGHTIAGGGFDPMLSLFSPYGKLLDEQDDAAECELVAENDGECRDVYFTKELAAGTYTVSIQQTGNASRGSLAAGYDYAYDDVQDQAYLDGFGGRYSHWAFDILNVNTTVQESPGEVPEPAPLLLLAAGTAGLAMVRRRRATRRA